MGNTKSEIIIPVSKDIQQRIFTIRGVQVMLDSDLAGFYGVETKMLNRAVKRNIERFPAKFMFRLKKDEWENLRFQIGTSNGAQNILRYQNGTSESKRGGRRYLPYVFTEQGVAMLSAVLKSTTAVKISIQIMNAFVDMRRFLANNASLFNRLDNIEKKHYKFEIETKENFNKIKER